MIATFLMLRFSKATALPSQFSTKIYGKNGNQGKCRPLFFERSAKFYKYTLDDTLTRLYGHYPSRYMCVGFNWQRVKPSVKAMGLLFFFLLVNMEPYGSKKFKMAFSESTHPIHSLICMCTLREALYQICYKNSEILKF